MSGPGTRFDEPVPPALDGERVDRAVALLTGLTRAEVAALIDAGTVELDGRTVVTRGRRVRAGQHLALDLPPAGEVAALQADPTVAVDVVHEDAHLIVVDKRAGTVVHPGAGVREQTLVHGLLARYPELAGLAEGPDADRPGIVHRLDRGTSGLMVVARTAEARDALRAQLAAHEVERVYLALVLGSIDSDEGRIDAPIGRSTRDPTRMAVAADGRSAATRYAVLGRFVEPVVATQLRCALETGRTHQIRVHLAAIGHPVVGDERYGGRRAVAPPGLGPLPGDRPWLHAAELTLVHPATGATMRWRSPLPADLGAVLDRLA